MGKITVKIIPNAKKNEVIGWEDNVLKIKIASPPVDGKANKELIHFLSKKYKCAKSQIKIIKGDTSRIKTLDISEELQNKIKNDQN